MTSMRNKYYFFLPGILVILVSVGGIFWYVERHPKPVYIAEGYGGYGYEQTKKNERQEPLRPAEDAYQAGKYKQAEALAQKIVKSASKSKDPAKQKTALEAQSLLAFSAARRKDFKLARDRFQILREEAAKLPDKGKPNPEPGVLSPTLEEEGTYQHAVCTMALGDKKTAQRELIQFMHDYPESTLLNGVIMRIERLNDGHLPKEAEAAWKQAKKIAEEREKARMMEQSMCGPECLAELIRRNGGKVDVKALAKEMGTNEMGTSMKALADTAKKHGFTAHGLRLTQDGLRKQPLPLIALVKPGHYVIVEKVSKWRVTVWTPGIGKAKPTTRSFDIKQWQTGWSGLTLTLQPKKANIDD